MFHDSPEVPQLVRCGPEIQPQTTWLQSCLSCNAVRFTRDSQNGASKESHKEYFESRKIVWTKQGSYFLLPKHLDEKEKWKGETASGHNIDVYHNTCILCRCAWLSGAIETELPRREIHEPCFPHLDLKTAPKLKHAKPTVPRTSSGTLGSALRNPL